MFYYNDQAVYNQTPFPMVPPLQQHPSTKRKRKTVRVLTLCFNEQLESYSVKSAALDGAKKSTSSAEPGPAQAVTPKPDKTEPVHVPPEVPASALFTIDEPKQTRLLVLTTPDRSERISQSSLSSKTPADEIEAQEAEPPKNEPEPGSEDESNDGVLSPVEEPNNSTMHKPEMENKRIQYSRDFLLSIQFMPDCMQKPEGLPSIPGCRYYLNTVVLMLCVEIFRTVRGFLNKLTAEMFNQLMKQVKEIHIDTEERLKGVVNLIFKKAIDEPNFSVGYRVMCKSLAAYFQVMRP
ncbi:hypothetical protein HF521_017003 [Silurus meridionalis]|uniref:MIF4G domain-containing protein n=1 Tax=Silurus meridionalis TaxID=175797 RepID=A0A8T0BRC6_SILME|nr:hypothetical protein HF521_017003 [Silurus meridionalis]